MRAMALAMMVMAVAQAQSTPPKSMPADAGTGRVAWFDITTTDLSKSQAFYGKLLDWAFRPVQGTNLAVEIVSGGTAIGTIRVAEGSISPFNGVVYVQVLDIQESCKKAERPPERRRIRRARPRSSRASGRDVLQNPARAAETRVPLTGSRPRP
jgi:hypothetical protein